MSHIKKYVYEIICFYAILICKFKILTLNVKTVKNTSPNKIISAGAICVYSKLQARIWKTYEII